MIERFKPHSVDKNVILTKVSGHAHYLIGTINMNWRLSSKLDILSCLVAAKACVG